MKKIIFIASVLFALANSNAQIGINTITPDTNVVLDIRHSSKGVLLPQVTTSVRTAKNANTPEGSLVYDAAKKEFFFKDGTSGEWVSLNVWRAEEGVSKDIRLASSETGRNVAVGYSSATAAKAKLDVCGKVRADDSLIGKTIKLDGAKVANLRKDGNDLRISADGKIYLEKDVQTSGSITVPAGSSFVGNGTIPVGGIILWSGTLTSLPSGWALCDGTNGRPDLRGRFVVGYDGTKTDYNSIGKKGGAETVTLNTNQIPNHNHSLYSWRTNGVDNCTAEHINWIMNSPDDDVKTIGPDNKGDRTTVATTSTGGGQAHENRPPYYVLAYIIRTN